MQPDPFRRRRFVAVFILALAITVAAWQTSRVLPGSQAATVKKAQPAAAAPAEPETAGQPDSGLAGQALIRLEIRDKDPRAGYSRDQFSQGWNDVDGCDTRNLILARDLQSVQTGPDGCTVMAGELLPDPYTGSAISFRRGKGTSSAVQIDHVVALSNAWQTGAQQLDARLRWGLYHDPLNLLAVDGPANVKKGDADAAAWLPQAAYQCRYVARQIAVKLKYLLWVTKAEYNAMRRVLVTCPAQMLPVESW